MTDDGDGAERWVVPYEPGPRRASQGADLPPSRPASRQYRSPRAAARLARTLLVADIGVRLLGALGGALYLALGRALLQGRGDAGYRALSELDRALGLLWWLQALVSAAAASAALSWFWAIYGNLTALGARGLRFGRRWSVLAWLLPPVHLWRPKMLVDDAWRASDPEAPALQRSTWRGRPVPGLLHLWWAAVVAATLTAYLCVAGAWLWPAPRTFRWWVGEQLPRVVAAQTMWAVAGVLSVLVVRRLSARQDARAVRLFAHDHG